MSNLMTVVPFLSPEHTHGGPPPNATTSPVSRPGCWAYPDMLEVGRMPEHNPAESRSHFAAWAIVSAPLVLGFDLSDEAKLTLAWPTISNREVIEISQTWVHGMPYPSGKLLASWQAPNVPTLAVRGACADTPCTDENPKCPQWAKEQQCEANPSYMHYHCKKSCHTCAHGNYTSWAYADGVLTAGSGLCVDLSGQLPGGHSGGNVMHALPCNASASTQKWAFNGTGGAIQTAASAMLEGREGSAPCLQSFDSWLWDRPEVNTNGCDASKPGHNQQWTLFTNGTLMNGQFGCIEVTDKQGPPTTVWAKPLDAHGKVALLAINGADKPQKMVLDFAKLLAPEHGALVPRGETWQARDVYAAEDLGLRASLTEVVGPHDCVLLVLTPA